MKIEQLSSNVDSLIVLYESNKLIFDEERRLWHILLRHQIFPSINLIDNFYKIIYEFTINDLRIAAQILLEHNVELKCGICGDDIHYIWEYSVDHIVPLSIGGSRTIENLQHSHNVCNWVKNNGRGYKSFYDSPELFNEYQRSKKYMEFLAVREFILTNENVYSSCRK